MWYYKIPKSLILMFCYAPTMQKMSSSKKFNLNVLLCPHHANECLKILIPHVILICVLLGYLSIGATILMRLETRAELLLRSRKLVKLSELMANLSKKSWGLVKERKLGEQEWTDTFSEYMVTVAETVDDRRPIRRELRRPKQISNIHSRWTFPTALLYVLTVLTTCGYGEVSVDTEAGKMFAVAFALIGIPLMFITAADIGKFLSETLLKLVDKWEKMVRRLKRPNRDRDPLRGVGTDEQKLWFPIGAYVGCICLYCSIGAAMFIHWQGHWSFVHAFHFGFNLIVTVGLGDLVVQDYLFLSLIVAFVIIGLSVVTMCVDLASTHLKAYFTRIHYFGRAKRFMAMSEDLREIVSLLSAMRKKKGGRMTWADLKRFLDNELRDRAFEPRELLFKLRYIDDTSSAMSTIRHNSCTSEALDRRQSIPFL